MDKLHELKILPKYMDDISNGKNFDVRFNDRNFEVGDFVLLREIEDDKYTDREMMVQITYILDDFRGLAPGYVAFSFDKTDCMGW